MGLLILLLPGNLLLSGMALVLCQDLLRTRQLTKRRASIEKTLLQWIASTLSHLRAGHSPRESFEGATRNEKNRWGGTITPAEGILTSLKNGMDFATALGNGRKKWPPLLTGTPFHIYLDILERSHLLGSEACGALSDLQDNLKEKQELKHRVKVATAQMRFQSLILCSLTPGLGLVLWVLSPQHIRFFWEDTWGHVLLGFMASLQGAGIWAMRSWTELKELT